ncbi:T9SS type A sorting domain-containing protein [Chryseobacterium sp. MFBS3-17]|uniref:T9SS type A sorting domain-containing protein n=1 Tax=Chryseobacterium sp. MFBS3-17 TaxID=2886689 RepID=UPI001D0DD6F7|nr:T9SS type A sorting domain-containing protein [Chryseobacterium sp. MFBS3-17]MCC2591590.1 T9SS type A sorting domain-containing protein [Chryseobacterium sp. MFBS3-17]
MKKILFLILFSGFGFAAGELSAQSRDNAVATSRNDDAALVAYPNPTKDVILLKAKDSSVRIKSVSFFSILGMQVASYSVNSNAAEINLEKLRPGKYLMRYTLSDNTQKIKQIIKQ